MWPNSGEILPAAFADSGVRVVSFRPHSVEPSGGGYLFGYEVDTIDAAGASSTVLTFVDTDPSSVEASRAAGGNVVADPGSGQLVRVWAYPADPALPALAAVTYPERVVELLARIGLAVSDPTLSVAAYRPGKRAVIKLESAEATLFLKVVRPSRAEPIAALHAAFAEAGLPVPTVVATQPDGLLILRRVDGVPAGTRVIDLAAGRAFVDTVVGLSETVARVHLTQTAQADALDNGSWHRRSLTGSLPDRASGIDAVYDEIEARTSTWSSDEMRVVHGDLHLEQLFVDPDQPGHVTGLLDIDTAGVGHAARDAGSLVAHLVVTAQWHRGNGDEEQARACERIADAVSDEWTDRHPDIADRLAPTVASQLLAHAGGQATLGTDTGRRKALQLVDAAEGALWPRRSEPLPGDGPTVGSDT
ncbi:phosphotransferase family enzyme [Frondihabitans sp. PhB188]|uniref:phosphotransferase n=1 Tax=Frondihabitans sp. PhB188 TaxID=2485200 RepID=UPI000F4659A6|nr:aminoglycoside phosphotransferase family protein [Frondihabitans sp. PhB188]ROQ38241.1 phosphotransferase family enzyme [Frondihabitans sp. PhB188]